MSDLYQKFKQECSAEIKVQGADQKLAEMSQQWLEKANSLKYSYHFEWLGRPIIQYPQDIMAVQEIIWQVQPDLIIETGIAHGGSLIMSASMLAMLDYCDAIASGSVLDPAQPKRRVLGIDIDIRAHNRAAIEAHPMSGRIDMIQGSSIDPDVISAVQKRAAQAKRVLVFLDSNHTHDHVLAELHGYAHLASIGSYCVVFDTVVEYLPKEMFNDRPWAPGDNPMTAMDAFLAKTDSFEIDTEMDSKLLLSVAPRGYLKRVR